MISPDRRDAQNLCGRGDAGATFRNTIVDHCRHPGLNGRIVDGDRCSSHIDEVADIMRQFEQLEEPDATAIARSAATLAADRFMDHVPDLKAERGVAWIRG